MTTFQYFYTDYCEDKTIPHDAPRAAPKEDILHSMNCVLHMPDNFIGIVDGNDLTLQFMVNEDGSIHVDIPFPDMHGSYVKTASLDDCLAMVKALGETIEMDEIDGLKFESW